MKFDKTFEENILAMALKDTGYLKKAAKILDAHHFNTPQHSWIWKVIRATWMTYREKATVRLVVAQAKADFPNDEDREPYIQLARKLYRFKPEVAASALDELSKFVRTVNAQLGMEKAARALEKGDIENVYNELRSVTKKDLDPTSYTLIDWIEGFDTRQGERKQAKENPDQYVRIPTGFKRLDAIIGGLQLGELGLMMATTGKGKSIMLTNLAHAAVRLGYPTVYFALEMPARQIAMRQDARWLKIPYKKFKEYDFTPSELRAIDERLKKVRNKWENKLKIISMPLRRCNINTVKDSLDELYATTGFRPQMLLLDSGDHMKSVSRMESYRLSQAEVYWDLKTMAEEDGYAIWSSTQAGREWANLVSTAEAAGESYDKARIADVVCSLNTPTSNTRSTSVRIAVDDDGNEVQEPDPALHANGSYVELYLAKYRDGPSRVTIPMDADFPIMFIQELDK